MTFGIGGYRVAGDKVCLKPTRAISKTFDKLDAAGNFTVQKQISIDTAKDILGQLGIKASKIAQSLPQTGSIDYFAAHGAMQMSSEGKELFSMVESLKKPISKFLAERLPKILRKIH